jgi:hypothetical protein
VRAYTHTPCQDLIRKGFPLKRLKCIFNKNKKFSCKDRFVNKNKINYIKPKTQAQLVFVSRVMSMCVQVSLCAPRLILRDPEVDDQVSIRWPWDLWHSNRWLLKNKPNIWPVELHPLRLSYILFNELWSGGVTENKEDYEA